MLNKSIHKGIEIMKRNGKVLSFKDVDKKEKVQGIWASYFIQEENVIVRGEYLRANVSLNYCLILAVDVITMEIRGKNVFYFF